MSTRCPSKRIRWRAALLIVPVFALCSVGCKTKTQDAPEVEAAVQAQRSYIGPISEEITADATLAPLTQAALSPRVSSPIQAEYVQRGAHVRRGQLLLTLEDRDLQGTALESQGSVAAAEAAYAIATEVTIPEDLQKAELDVAQAKANLDLANRTAIDRNRLFEQGALPGREADSAAAAAVASQASYDTAKKHLQSVQKTMRQADAKSAAGLLTSARGRLMSAKAQIAYTSLRSPIDGVVTDRPLFPGETAVAGSPVITIMDTSSLLAKLHLAQSSARQLKLGSTAEIEVPGATDRVPATVSFISPSLDSGSSTVEVWLKLPNQRARFKAGSTVRAVLPGRVVAHALQVPSSAVLPVEDGSSNVMVVGVDHLAKLRAVTLGIRTPESVEITSGLSAGDVVITDGSYGLEDGARVVIGAKQAGAEARKK